MNEEIRLRNKLKEKYQNLISLKENKKEIGTEKDYIDAGIKKWKETDLLRDERVDIEMEKYVEELDDKIDFSKPVIVDKQTISDSLEILVTKSESENSGIIWTHGSKEVLVYARNTQIKIPMNIFFNFINKYMKSSILEHKKDVEVKW